MRVEDEGIGRGGDVWGSDVIGVGKKTGKGANWTIVFEGQKRLVSVSIFDMAVWMDAHTGCSGKSTACAYTATP